MHTTAYANKISERHALLTDPNSNYWEKVAFDAFDSVTKRIGEDATDKWFDETISAEPNWKEIAEKCIRKALELDTAAKVDAALDRHDWDSIEYE